MEFPDGTVTTRHVAAAGAVVDVASFRNSATVTFREPVPGSKLGNFQRYHFECLTEAQLALLRTHIGPLAHRVQEFFDVPPERRDAVWEMLVGGTPKEWIGAFEAAS